METKEKIKIILEFIAEMEKQRSRDAFDVYINGNCGNLFTIFKIFFPEAQAYVVAYKDGEKAQHVVTKIGDVFYDIKGECKARNLGISCEPATDDDIEKRSNSYEVLKMEDRGITDKTFLSDLRRTSELYFKSDLVKINEFCENTFGINHDNEQSTDFVQQDNALAVLIDNTIVTAVQ